MYSETIRCSIAHHCRLASLQSTYYCIYIHLRSSRWTDIPGDLRAPLTPIEVKILAVQQCIVLLGRISLFGHFVFLTVDIIL